MTHLILSGISLLLWAVGIIVIYYSNYYSSISHIESSSGFSGYLMAILFLYLLYKTYSVFIAKKRTLKIWFLGILWLIFLHILILTGFYSSLPEITQSPLMKAGDISSIVLFFHIIELLIYPLILILCSRNLWYTLGKICLSSWKDIDMRIRVPMEISLWFAIFTASLVLIAGVGYFTLPALLWSIVLLLALWYPGMIETYRDIQTRYLTIENHDIRKWMVEWIHLKLLSIEFWFFFITFLFGIALINVIRPMPIGWDDLGVYMNFPKIIALSGELLAGSWMYAWQLITSTGFLFGNNAAQAFYINQLGGILAVGTIISSLSYMLESRSKKMILSLPILFAALYYAMPMTVFQQAKDMKLDPAYLFFSISGLMPLLLIWKEQFTDKKTNLILLLIVGIIVWFSFSIKFTSVMLILGCVWLIFYRILSFWWYIGFFFLFLSIFTWLDLWKIMNVPMPRENPEMLFQISLFLWIIGLISLLYSFYEKSRIEWSEKCSTLFLSSAIFTLGIILGCSPWLMKNIHEIGSSGFIKNPMQILWWSGGTFSFSYSKIYTDAELANIEKKAWEDTKKAWPSENEDMGRYLWYDSGLNNYLKLPANLTFQKNQSGEFTDITYIFLAFFPISLIFIRSRRYIYSILIFSIVLFIGIYYFTPLWVYISMLFGKWTLAMQAGNIYSFWYLFLLLANIIFLAATHFLIEKNEENKKIRDVMMFGWIYAFLFMVSAFGIVWYGIVIYFIFFMLIGLGLSDVIWYTHDEEKNDDLMGIKMTLSAIVAIFIAVYFIRSAFPHGWNNLKSAYYNEYKYNTLSQEESIFAYRSDYLVPIATLNLKDPFKIFDNLKKKLSSEKLKDTFKDIELRDIPLDKWHSFIMQYRNSPDVAIRNDARMIGSAFYNDVLYPKKENQNLKWIYRIGTFMTYLIHENRIRYFEDSLIFSFNTYFYDPIPEIAIERMKKIWLGYLLVDLNAATIDRDPRRALTTRFEHLLVTMNAKNLRLVSTDNFCLELALGERKKWKLKTDEEFIDIAGTNYESYREGKAVNRGQKLVQCQSYIIKMINENTYADYPTIETIKQEIITWKANQDTTKLQQILNKYIWQSWFALFEIIDTPNTPVPTIWTGGVTTGTWVRK